MSETRARVGIIGATGYTGAELLRLLWGHPNADVVLLTSTRQAGTPVADLYPALAGVGLVYETFDAASAKEACDGFFICTPHAVSMDVAQALVDDRHWVVDLSADFRLKDARVYEEWYGAPHRAGLLLEEAVYGLPELFGDELTSARLIANPGCYPTASLLALGPALSLGLARPDTLIVDAISGVSGAGREPAPAYMFCEADESVTAYKVAGHRHTPEIEQGLSRLAGTPVTLTFTPHLAPLSRGILATCYAQLDQTVEVGEAVAAYQEFYQGQPFIHVHEPGVMPATRHVAGSNSCHIGLSVDHRTGRLIAVAAIDNLVKGASGQAVQNMNVLLGVPETTGLPVHGMVV
jgi:N-acetyl-gamma-glutamyl-phosphate reductase